ncbi:MAG: molybdopterin-dependent oxidoreductase [Pseudomonadota bacterium]
MADGSSSAPSPAGAAARQTTCAYCGVGCGIAAEVKSREGRSVLVAGDLSHPANIGRLCAKGTALGETLGADGRLLRPQVRGADGVLRAAFWGEALDRVASTLKKIRDEHGPDAIAFYVSGQLLTEDYYVANKFVKGFVGTGNIDTNSRLCMASTVVAQQRAFGEDAVPGCYEDLEEADLIVLSGSNTAWCHPVLYQRIKAAKAARGTKIVVLDPRRTATCEIADLHLPIRAGTDAAVFNGLLAFLADRGALDAIFVARHTAGFDAALAAARADAGAVDAQGIDALAARCGVSGDDLFRFYRWFAETPRTVSCWSQGVNQSSGGTDKVNAIINCHLATGRIGKPGAAPLSLTGQPNAMGGREVGGLATQLAAHLPFDDHAARAQVARFWQAPALATDKGLKAVDLFAAVAAGKVKFLWIMGTNPAVSMPDAERVRAAIAGCEFVVVSDCVDDTDTLRHAHVALPAHAWGEKDGTVTNSERRISRQRALVAPVGEAKPDWWAVAQVARRLGYVKAFDYDGPAAIFREHATLSALVNPESSQRRFDLGALSAIDAATYENLTPFQWPWRAGSQPAQRLFGDGRFAHRDGRARFIAIATHAPCHAVGTAFPFVLNTGRVRDQWHTMTRTGTVPRLNRHRDEPFVEVHPDDAVRTGVVDGGLARVETAHAAAVLRVQVTDSQHSGALFVPMHWTRVLTAGGIAGALPNPAVDPWSGQPELKHTPARIAPVTAAATAVVLSRAPLAVPETALYAVRQRTREGWRLQVAAAEKPASLTAWLRSLMPEELRAPEQGGEWQQAESGARSVLLNLRDGFVQAVAVAAPGGTVDEVAAQRLIATPLPSDDDRALLFSGLPQPSPGRVVCACLEVTDETLRTAAPGCADVEALCSATRAGTRCGTCIPELGVFVGSSSAACSGDARRIPLRAET